jgi:GH15 family glucan-1,4-alpha-glucosidase
VTEVVVDLEQRSLEIILGNQAASGAFVASPTFSQYGYSWLRDGAFIAWALDLIGEHDAAARFHDWVSDLVLARADALARASVAGRRRAVPTADDYLHCRYSVDGSVVEGDWPTFQLDGPGIWLWALGEHLRYGGDLSPRRARGAAIVAAYLVALWTLPSYDAWEEGAEHVHSSTLGAIATGLRAADGFVAAGGGYGKTAAQIVRRLRADFADQGFLGKWAGNRAVDASLLWIGYPYRLLELDDPLFAATLRRIEDELVSADGGVYRYREDTYYGGGQWVLLTASLGMIYAARKATGDEQRARRCLEWITRQADADGSLPEQVGTNALHPQWVDHWQQLWGTSARPLLWSHALYLALRHQLAHAR